MIISIPSSNWNDSIGERIQNDVSSSASSFSNALYNFDNVLNEAKNIARYKVEFVSQENLIRKMKIE